MTDLAALFAAADRARDRAYAPYSGFHVGAAILGPDGSIHAGCNIENAAYPEGTCAEAGAIAHMIMAGITTISEIAIVGGKKGEATVLCPPCGGCRQKLREFGGRTAKIHLRDASGDIQSYSVDDLLKHSFGPDNLAKGIGA